MNDLHDHASVAVVACELAHLALGMAFVGNGMPQTLAATKCLDWFDYEPRNFALAVVSVHVEGTLALLQQHPMLIASLPSEQLVVSGLLMLHRLLLPLQ